MDREKGVIPIARAMLGHYISSVLEVVMLDEPHVIDRRGSISDTLFQ